MTEEKEKIEIEQAELLLKQSQEKKINDFLNEYKNLCLKYGFEIQIMPMQLGVVAIKK